MEFYDGNKQCVPNGCKEEAEANMRSFEHLLANRNRSDVLQNYLKERWDFINRYYQETLEQEMALTAMYNEAKEYGKTVGIEKTRTLIAYRLLGSGMDLQEISKVTELELSFIMELKEDRFESLSNVSVKLLAYGMTPEKVSKLTGLSIEEVRSLMESKTNRNMNGSAAIQL